MKAVIVCLLSDVVNPPRRNRRRLTPWRLMSQSLSRLALTTALYLALKSSLLAVTELADRNRENFRQYFDWHWWRYCSRSLADGMRGAENGHENARLVSSGCLIIDLDWVDFDLALLLCIAVYCSDSKNVQDQNSVDGLSIEVNAERL